MPFLVISPEAGEDLERLEDFLARDFPAEAEATIGLIGQTLEVLKSHPLIGRPTTGGLRELVISRGRSGYIALYDFDPDTDLVVVRAVRHQREVGFEE
jgi:plasmid stabilization system protein ParE